MDVSPMRDGSIVAETTTACGFRTIRIGKRNNARNALAANRAAALGGIGLRRIGSSWAVAAIGLGIRRLHPKRHGQTPTLAIAVRAGLIIDLPLDTLFGPME